MNFEDIEFQPGDKIQDSDGEWWIFVRDDVDTIRPMVFEDEELFEVTFTRRGWLYGIQDGDITKRHLLPGTHQPVNAPNSNDNRACKCSCYICKRNHDKILRAEKLANDAGLCGSEYHLDPERIIATLISQRDSALEGMKLEILRRKGIDVNKSL